jgi:hypothetical protein
MVVCQRLWCVLVATATAAAISGCGGAGPEGWVLATDSPSGLSARLPGHPSVQNNVGTDAGGEPVAVRQYFVTSSDGRSAALFSVAGAPGRVVDVDQALRLVVAGTGSGATVTRSRHVDVEGHPAVDARYTTTIDGQLHVVFARIISDRGYLVEVETNGPLPQENALNAIHQQILSTLHLI